MIPFVKFYSTALFSYSRLAILFAECNYLYLQSFLESNSGTSL